MKKIKLLVIVTMLAFICLSIKAQVPQLWGMTSQGCPPEGDGEIFKINGNGTGFQVMFAMNPWPKLASPYGSLLKANDGKLYGMNYGNQAAGGDLFSFDPATSIFTDFVHFDSANVHEPLGSLIQVTNSKLYGMTTAYIDSISHNYYFLGAIFNFDINTHTFTDVYHFNNSTGSYPIGSLLKVANNKLYGLTSGGGSHLFGSIFSFDYITNSYADIHDFDSLNGSYPYGNFIQATNGLLYGLTSKGGTNNGGALFSIDTATNTFINVHNFQNISGMNPYGSLLQANDGNLYGMACTGGANNHGVLFQYDISSNIYTDKIDLNSSNGYYDTIFQIGVHPYMIQASDNKLYGITTYGGGNGFGTVFQYDLTTNTYNVIFNFDNVNGAYPMEGLTEDGSSSGISTNTIQPFNLKVFPNPANNTITFRTNLSGISNYELAIYDVLGQEVYHQAIINQESTIINLPQLSNGVYFYQLSNNKETFRGKFVVEK